MKNEHVDLDFVKRFYERFFAIRPKMLENARRSSQNLGNLMGQAFDDAACEHHLGLLDRVPLSIKLGVEAGLAMFICAASPGQLVTFELGGETLNQQARISPDQVHTGRWEKVWYGANILGDSDSLRTLCSFPLSLALTSPTVGEAVDELWVRVLHTLTTTGRFDADLMTRALECTDPSKLPDEVVDLTLYLTVPCLDLLFRLAMNDAPGFQKALKQALDKHRRYWGSPENASDPTGFVSWPLSALVAMAQARGMNLPLQHPYLLRLP